MRLDELLVLFVALALLCGVVVAVRRSNQLFILQWGAGKLRVVRGRLPERLFRQLQEGLIHSRVTAARLVVVRDGTAARLSSSELDAGQLQVMRNVVGQFALAAIRRGNRTRQR